MLPYADLPYFAFALIVALPAIALGVAGRSRRGWILAAAAIGAVVHFAPGHTAGLGPAVSTLWLALGYAIYQTGVMLGFARWRARRASTVGFAVALVLCLAPLVLVKLVPVLRPDAVWGFLGISYVTFRAVDVLVVTQDRLVASVRPATYLAFLFFLPTVSSGPIDRYRRFVADYERIPDRATVIADLDRGVHRTFVGVLYKFVIAAAIKQFWLDPATSAHGWIGLASYTYAYSLYLFFDFAGYSAIAVGVSRCFGVRTPENFNLPFLASNIADFWNRWHISLSTLFRDHIFMRFAMAATKGRWFRNRHTVSYLGFLVTFLLMGAWHGLEPRYLLYGLFHAALLIGHGILTRLTGRWPNLPRSRVWRAIGVATTFNAVCVGFLIFSGRLGG